MLAPRARHREESRVPSDAWSQNDLTEEIMDARARAVADGHRVAGSAAGSENRTGTRFNEWNAAEVGIDMRADRDPRLGYARRVEWDVGPRIGNQGTRPEAFTRGETLDAVGARQLSHSDFTRTGVECGHAAGQQFSGGDADVAREPMKMSNVWAMRGLGETGVNQEFHKLMEERIVAMRHAHRRDAVRMRVEATIGDPPGVKVNARGRRIVVPERFDFTVWRAPAAGEAVVVRERVPNR